MPSESEKDAAARTRIMTHMNADHQDSISRYLEHHHSVSSFGSRNAYLSNIDFTSMTVLPSPNSSKAYKIAISPPMTSWSEARPRVVEMDAEATAALGRSAVTVKKYTPPRGFMAIVWIASFVTFIAFSRRANFRNGSWCYDGLLKYVPSFGDFCWRIQPLVLYPMVVLHATEAVYMERSRLRRHTVRAFGRVWWTWLFSTFVEGIGAFLRFDQTVKEEEERKAKARH